MNIGTMCVRNLELRTKGRAINLKRCFQSHLKIDRHRKKFVNQQLHEKTREIKYDDGQRFSTL